MNFTSTPHWNWVQFVCAFTIAGVACFLAPGSLLDELWIHATKTLVVAGACGLAARRYGDDAWRWIITALRWL